MLICSFCTTILTTAILVFSSTLTFMYTGLSPVTSYFAPKSIESQELALQKQRSLIYEEEIQSAKKQAELFSSEINLMDSQLDIFRQSIGVEPVQQYIVTKQLILLKNLPPEVKKFVIDINKSAEIQLKDKGWMPLIESIIDQYSAIFLEEVAAKLFPDKNDQEIIHNTLKNNIKARYIKALSEIDFRTTEISDIPKLLID